MFKLNVEATGEINTKISLGLVKKNVTTVHILLCLLHGLMKPYVAIEKRSSHIDSLPHMRCLRSADDIKTRYPKHNCTSYLWRKHMNYDMQLVRYRFIYGNIPGRWWKKLYSDKMKRIYQYLS